MKNKNILRMFVGIVVFSCGNSNKNKSVDISNNEKELTEVEQTFLETVRRGELDQVTILYTSGNISDEAIQQAIEIAIENKDSYFFDFFKNNIFPKICDDYVKDDGSHLNLLLFLSAKEEDFNNVYVMGPLHMATEKGCLGIVKLLVDNGTNVDSKDCLQCSPLHVAARKGHIGIVQFLVGNGADVNSKDRWENTPLHVANFKGFKSIVCGI